MQAGRILVTLGCALVAACALAPAMAQTQTRIYNTDSAGNTGTCNAIPFGITTASTIWGNQKYQTIMAASLFGKKVGAICSLGFTNCQTGFQQFSTIDVKMDYFPGSGSTLSTTFSSNITSSAVTVLSARNYVWHTLQDQWVHIGLQKPFVYIPQLGDLVVEITVTGAVGSAGPFRRGGAPLINVQRVFAIGNTWSNNQPPATGSTDIGGLKMVVGFDAWALDTYGAGCAGSNNQTPALTLGGSSALGQSVTLGCAGALSGAGMFLVVGLAAPSDPLDMTPLGAPSCRIYPSLDVVLPVSADSSGLFSQKFPIANDGGLVNTKTYLQFFPHDQNANPFGTSSSNYGRVLIGR